MIDERAGGQNFLKIDDIGGTNELIIKDGSESPLIGKHQQNMNAIASNSEIKKSFKDVASYLTPNRSSNKSMNHTS